ncbi:hypothetical protein ElyMa_001372000 [Elysia marginata]|uniref:Uncharacterized protein n=1 Tax=Elysia marginata TaxID=1093978 RepID=A0AAV4IRQ1_9GAST|nr:hypothetical protein ElyMa_001372000 [Elysia marginata]
MLGNDTSKGQAIALPNHQKCINPGLGCRWLVRRLEAINRLVVASSSPPQKPAKPGSEIDLLRQNVPQSKKKDKPAPHRPQTGYRPAPHRPQTGSTPAPDRPETGSTPAPDRLHTGSSQEALNGILLLKIS